MTAPTRLQPTSVTEFDAEYNLESECNFEARAYIKDCGLTHGFYRDYNGKQKYGRIPREEWASQVGLLTLTKDEAKTLAARPLTLKLYARPACDCSLCGAGGSCWRGPELPDLKTLKKYNIRPVLEGSK